MIRKSLLPVLALLLAAGPALARPDCGMSRADDRQALSCLPGTAWDAATGTCLRVATS